MIEVKRMQRRQDRKMTVRSDDGGKGILDDNRNIGKGGRWGTDDNRERERKTRMERMRGTDTKRQRGVQAGL